MSDMEPRAKTLAKTLRQMAGDGSIEWLHEPIRVNFLLDIADALDENEELREELAKARDPQRISGQADPSSFVYAIEQLREFRWQHATNDEDAIPYINNVAAAHEHETEELRRLLQDTSKAARMLCHAWEGSCSKEAEGMSLHAVCPISDTSELCVCGGLYDRLRDLEIEEAEMSDTKHKAGEYVYGTDGHEEHWLTGERIVRCGDCKHFEKDVTPHDEWYPHFCSKLGTDVVTPSGFCSYGEDKEEA